MIRHLEHVAYASIWTAGPFHTPKTLCAESSATPQPFGANCFISASVATRNYPNLSFSPLVSRTVFVVTTNMRINWDGTANNVLLRQHSAEKTRVHTLRMLCDAFMTHVIHESRRKKNTPAGRQEPTQPPKARIMTEHHVSLSLYKRSYQNRRVNHMQIILWFKATWIHLGGKHLS